MTLTSSATFTWFPTLATTTSFTAYCVEYYRTRAEARDGVKALTERSSIKPTLHRIRGLDGKPKWQVRWYPKTITYNAA